MKKILPYIILTIVFCVIFILTQIIETRILYLGINSNSGDVIYNHKTSIQKWIFIYGLAICITILNILESLKSNHLKINKVILIGSISIAMIYLINFFLSKIFYSDGFNIYNDWRKNLGFDLSVWTILMALGLSMILNWIKPILKANK